MKLRLGLVGLLAALQLAPGCDKKADDKKADDKKADAKTDDKKSDAKAADAKTDDVKAAEPAGADDGAGADDAADDDAKADDAAADDGAAGEAVLTLGVAKIGPKDAPDKTLEIAADGTVKVGPEPDKTLTLSTDGTVKSPDGKVVATVGTDGAVTIDGKETGIVLDDTGLTMTKPDGEKGTIKFAEDGSVAFEPAAAPGLEVVTEGCTGPMVKTCALVLAVSMFMPAEPVVDDAKAVAEPVEE